MLGWWWLRNDCVRVLFPFAWMCSYVYVKWKCVKCFRTTISHRNPLMFYFPIFLSQHQNLFNFIIHLEVYMRPSMMENLFQEYFMEIKVIRSIQFKESGQEITIRARAFETCCDCEWWRTEIEQLNSSSYFKISV